MAGERRLYLAYMLRLWRVSVAGRAVWRASLEDPHTGERTGFGTLESLLRFLEEQTGETSNRDIQAPPAEQQ